MAVPLLGLACAAAIVVVYPRLPVGHVRVPRTAAMQVRRSVELWRSTHAGCPTLERLRDDGAIDPQSKLTDPWGTPFVIVCDEDETTVISLGPDRQKSADDIAVPEPARTRD